MILEKAFTIRVSLVFERGEGVLQADSDIRTSHCKLVHISLIPAAVKEE